MLKKRIATICEAKNDPSCLGQVTRPMSDVLHKITGKESDGLDLKKSLIEGNIGSK